MGKVFRRKQCSSSRRGSFLSAPSVATHSSRSGAVVRPLFQPPESPKLRTDGSLIGPVSFVSKPLNTSPRRHLFHCCDYMRDSHAIVFDELLRFARLPEHIFHTDKFHGHRRFLRQKLGYRTSHASRYLVLLHRYDCPRFFCFFYNCFCVEWFYGVHIYHTGINPLFLQLACCKKRIVHERPRPEDHARNLEVRPQDWSQDICP